MTVSLRITCVQVFLNFGELTHEEDSHGNSPNVSASSQQSALIKEPELFAADELATDSANSVVPTLLEEALGEAVERALQHPDVFLSRVNPAEKPTDSEAEDVLEEEEEEEDDDDDDDSALEAGCHVTWPMLV